MSDLTPNKFALIIENMVKERKISYMDAILEYCKTHEIANSHEHQKPLCRVEDKPGDHGS